MQRLREHIECFVDSVIDFVACLNCESLLKREVRVVILCLKCLERLNCKGNLYRGRDMFSWFKLVLYV
jgi:hypothetical protein